MASEDSSPQGTFRRFVYERYPGVFRAYYGVRFMGSLSSIWDSLARGIQDSLAAPFLSAEYGPAYDALDELGAEMSIPVNLDESWLSYRDRLRAGWEAWDEAGSSPGLVNRLNEAGYVGGIIDRTPGGTWSEFRLILPPGSHPVVAPAPIIGTFVLGDGTRRGPVGLTTTIRDDLRRILLHWKPSRWKASQIAFDIDGQNAAFIKVQ